MVAELNHRVRNMLQVVMAVFQRTLRRSGSLEEFAKAFRGRVMALARAHELVSAAGWKPVPLRELALKELDPYADGKARILLEGPRGRADAADRARARHGAARAGDQCLEIRRAVGAAGPCDDRWSLEGRRPRGAAAALVRGGRTAGAAAAAARLRLRADRAPGAARPARHRRVRVRAGGLAGRDRLSARGGSGGRSLRFETADHAPAARPPRQPAAAKFARSSASSSG